MRQIKRIAVSLVLALGALLQLHAQNRAVGGTVLDASGQPVVGAVVMVPGTNNHMFKVKASSATSTLDIKVTDRFGNVYTE